MTQWRPDVLGDEFECTDIDLGTDNEGPLCATLVRALPERRGFWKRFFGSDREFEQLDVLYVHGWSDYFFQKQLARFFTSRGARFYALDLRKYGRSLREGQTFGYVEHLDEYDAEIAASVAIIRGKSASEADQIAALASERKLVLFGHSTGGLVLSLWADRHRGIADALLLNSPWLELQITGAARRAIAPMISLQAWFSPRDVAMPQLDLGFYTLAQRANCSPEELAAVNLAWRPEHTMPIRAGWLRAVIAGHERISAGIDVGVPSCVLLSAKFEFALNWNDNMLAADTVLEVDEVAKAALKLGTSVTVERIPGALHDVFLSAPDARADAFSRARRWLRGWQITA